MRRVTASFGISLSIYRTQFKKGKKANEMRINEQVYEQVCDPSSIIPHFKNEIIEKDTQLWI